MGWADAAGAVRGVVHQQLLERMQAQQLAAQRQEAVRRGVMETRSADRADRGLDLQQQLFDANQARQGRLDDQAAQQHTATQATALGDQIPPDAFLAADDPAAGTMQRGGLGSLLTKQEPTQAMGAEFTGPMPNAESPQQAQVGRPGGFLKTRSQKQIDTDADNARQLETVRATQAEKGLADTRAAATDARLIGAAAETARHNKAMEARPVGGGSSRGGGEGDASNVEAIADAIARGEQPPETTGLYRLGGPVRAALAKKGYPLATAQQDFRATTRHFATLNGSQQTRMRQAVDNASHSLDVIDDLSGQWQGGKFPLLNKAQLAAAKAGTLGPQAQQIATNLEAQITDVASELANVYMGGNSPTDQALTLASKNLSADWTAAQLKSAIQLARRNLQIRQNSIQNTGVLGASAGNPYAGGQPAAPGAAPASAAPAGGVEYDFVNGKLVPRK